MPSHKKEKKLLKARRVAHLLLRIRQKVLIMKTRFSTCKFLGLLLAAGLVSGQAMAQSSATLANAEAFATILKPISIAAGDPLRFGSVVAGAGTVTVTPGGDRAVGGDVKLLSIPEVGSGAASFTVTGQGNAVYLVALPKEGEEVLLKSGTNTMKVTDFKTSPATGNNFQLDEKGSQIFNVGGMLNVGATQAAGEYRGEFSVTVNYN